MGRTFVPERGDIVWLEFDPQAGREQAGHRPALVLSPAYYNRSSSLALFCPITSRVRGYPFEVVLPHGLPVQGAILSDQVRSLDWKARSARRFCVVAEEVLEEVYARVRALLEEE